MTIKKPILAITAVLIGYFALQAFNFIKGLQIEFFKIRLGGNILAPEIYADFKITNPTTFEVVVNGIDGVVNYNDQTIATVQSLSEFKVQANTFVISNVKIIPTIGGAVQILKQFLARTITNDFYFVGHVWVSNIPFSINQKLSA